MAGPIKDPNINQQPTKTHIDLVDVADFLFGARSIQRIATGKGSWSDLVDVGVTAATFLIPPAKLLKLSGSSLNKVIKASEQVVASEAASVAAKRAAQTTIDNANQLQRMSLAQKNAERVKGYPALTNKQGVSELTEPSNLIKHQPIEQDIKSQYYGTGSDRTKKQIAEDIYEAKPKLKETKPAQMTPEEEAFQKQFDAEFPSEPVKAPEAGKATVINRKTGELEFVDPRRLSQQPKIPKDLRVSPEVDTVAYALYKVESLTRNGIKLKRAGKLDEFAANADEIAKYNEQIKTIGRTLSPQDADKAGKLSEQLRIAKGMKTTKFDPEKAKQQLETLRNDWKSAKNAGDKERIKRQAQVIADRLKKMEGK